jgi:toxin ParE1/3/4
VHLEWSVLALADREAIFDSIEADSLTAVVAVDQRIEERIRGLVQFPEMGRPGQIDGTRELVISGTPYIAAYCIIDGTMHVLRVLHGGRRWPDEVPEQSDV